MTAPDRAWVEGLLEGTTPGPWWENCDEVRAGDGDGTGDADEYDCVATCGLADARLIAAAPDLAAAVLDVLDERDALRAERDRLVRILAVERGDESAAPEGWVWDNESGGWLHGPSGLILDAEVAGRRVVWRVGAPHHMPDGDVLYSYSAAFPTALEAMEAADAARGGDDG